VQPPPQLLFLIDFVQQSREIADAETRAVGSETEEAGKPPVTRATAARKWLQYNRHTKDDRLEIDLHAFSALLRGQGHEHAPVKHVHRLRLPVPAWLNSTLVQRARRPAAFAARLPMCIQLDDK
jgi:hypothetical protein